LCAPSNQIAQGGPTPRAPLCAAYFGPHAQLAQQGLDPMPITPAAFDAQIKREIDAILALAKAANLKFN
jgi:hypothetical protein